MVNNHRPCVTDPIINSCVFMNTHPTLDGQPTIFSNVHVFSQECSNANHHSAFQAHAMVEAQFTTVMHARGFLQQRPFGMHPQVFIYLY